jgi:hypothetical protein
MRARAIVIGLVAGLVAGLMAGCGTAKPLVTPAPTDDVGRARLLVLSAADLPGAWTARAHSTDKVADRENRRAAACSGVPDQAAVDTADIFGTDFVQGAQIVASEALFVRTATDAAKTVAALKGARALSCATASVRPILTAQLRKQGISATVQSVRVTRRVLAVRDFVTAFRVVAKLGAAGSTLTIVEDVVFLARGRAQVRATFVDVGIAFPSALQLTLVKKLSAKLADV